MQLEQKGSKLCIICREHPPDPNREDGACWGCGNYVDKYAEEPDTLNLETEE